MSRAASYRSAAVDLRRASALFTDIATAHRRTDADVIGAVGPVAAIHERSVRTVCDHLATAADEMAHLAVECDRRADVCDAYDRHLSAWWALPWDERFDVARPCPPAGWVHP